MRMIRINTDLNCMTSNKQRVNLTMDEETIRKAKEMGLNMSKIAENAINKYIERLEGVTAVKMLKEGSKSKFSELNE
jgi:post-segregation antitoxin (ccd killing protein)